MGTYVLKRLILMVFTFVLISFLIFIIINAAPGRAGQTQLSGGEGESVRDAAGAREGYLLFKLQYGLNRPLLGNTRYDLDPDEVLEAVEVVVQNLSATIPGEAEALSVGATTGRIISRLAYPEYWALSDRLSDPDLDPADRALLESQRLDLPFDPIDQIRPPRPDPADLVEAQENLEDWGFYSVPALYEVAHSHRNPKVRWQAVEYLTLNAQERRVNPESAVIVPHHPERWARRFLLGRPPHARWLQQLRERFRGEILDAAGHSEAVEPESFNVISSAIPRTDMDNWTYELNAPQGEVDEVMALWEDWYERNAYRMEYDFWEKARIFFSDTRLYVYWSRLLQGDLGVSSQFRQPVVQLIFTKWKYSIYLSLLAVFFAYFLSVPIGLYSAVKRGGLFDRGFGLILFLMYSLPSFFVATLLQNYLTRANESGVADILEWVVRVGLGVVLPVFVALRVRASRRERARLKRGVGATALEIADDERRIAWQSAGVFAIAVPLGLGVAELLFRMGMVPVYFLVAVALPTYYALRPWVREKRRAERAGSKERVPFPTARAVGLWLAGGAIAWLLTLIVDFFPAPVSGFSTQLIDGQRPGERLDFYLNVDAWTYVKDVATHLVLPVACLTYASLAYLSRYARAGLLDVINSDYIRTARAKGLSEPVVILKHAVRNGMIPILTLLATALPALVGGSIVIEYIFDIPGIGNLVLDAVRQKDFNVVMGVLQISAVMTVIGILLSDISYALVDPRIQFD